MQILPGRAAAGHKRPEAVLAAPVNAWAILRFALGMAQMFGAVFSLGLLVATGVNQLTLTATITTCLLTVVSILLFGRKSNREKE